MTNLDDPKTYESFDPSELGARLAELPNHCAEAWKKVGEAQLTGLSQSLDHVVICGMGGSAIAGDLAADLAEAQGGLPITVVRDFRLPFTPNDRTLVVVCSYSGGTQETLSLYQQAVEAGSPIVAITGGGVLAQLAAGGGVPILNINTKGEPRSAVGYNLMLLLGLLQKLGLVETKESDVPQAIKAIEQQIDTCGPDRPTGENPAKQIAVELRGRIPLICGGGIFRGMARRWKTQLNENAKVWAFFETIPELLHNTVESFRTPSPNGAPITALVLEPSNVASDVASRYRVVPEMLQRHGIPHRTLQGKGDSPLAQLLSMLVLGDYVSYYLAVLQGVDPSPNPSIDEAKRLLAQ
jgi:glucose/mannose-6-phosphate isomerase